MPACRPALDTVRRSGSDISWVPAGVSHSWHRNASRYRPSSDVEEGQRCLSRDSGGRQELLRTDEYTDRYGMDLSNWCYISADDKP